MNFSGKISVIGIGKLGLCMSLCFENSGFSVLGVDKDEEYINSINNKTLESFEPKVVDYLRMSRKFKATDNLEEGLNYSDIIFIVVPTPAGNGIEEGENKYYDHSILVKLLSDINQLRIKNKHLIISCTVMPGFIQQTARKLILDCEDCTLNYNPEFIAQGSIINNFLSPDIVLIGEENKEAGNLLEKIYSTVTNCKKIYRLSIIEVEIAKIALNGFITTKIAYANLIGDLCLSMGIKDPCAVLEAISNDSRVGDKSFRYGYSYGGQCYPRDLLALSQTLRNVQIIPTLPMGSHLTNEEHIRFQVKRFLDENKDEYIFTDICYKPESKIPIIDHSAKLRIAEILARGYDKKVTIRDEPHLIELVKKKYGNLFEY